MSDSPRPRSLPRLRSIALLVLAATAAAGCRPGDAKGNVRHLGAPLEGEVVTLRDLATRREALRGRTVTAEGTVTFVCQEKGCFMEVEDDGVDANVRVRDHAFSVPKDAAGRRARFSGRVLYLWEGKDTDAAHLPRAMIEIDATGVELR